MKALCALLLIASVTFVAAAQTTTLNFSWVPTVTTNQLSYYKLYSTTSLSLPMTSWTVVTNISVPATNVIANVQKQTLIYLITSVYTNTAGSVTNFVFDESDPSNPVFVTAVGGGNLKVSK